MTFQRMVQIVVRFGDGSCRRPLRRWFVSTYASKKGRSSNALKLVRRESTVERKAGWKVGSKDEMVGKMTVVVNVDVHFEMVQRLRWFDVRRSIDVQAWMVRRLIRRLVRRLVRRIILLFLVSLWLSLQSSLL